MKRNSKFNSRSKRLFLASVLAGLTLFSLPNISSASILPLNLGTSATYGVLASSAITSANPSSVTGTAGSDIGVGGATAPTGVINHSGSTNLGGTSLTALTAAALALADNRGGTSTGVELGVNRTFVAGAYDNGTMAITGNMNLDAAGDPNAVFIFNTASTLITAVSSTVTLLNGAQACNVFWQVGSSATLGTGSTIVGHVIAQASITANSSTTVNGQLIGITGAVTLDSSTVLNNSCASTPAPVVATPTPTPTPVVSTPAPVGNDNGGTTVATPTVTPVVIPISYGTVHIIKVIVNTHQGTATASSFLIHITHNGKEVAGSPLEGIGSPGREYTLPVGSYVISESQRTDYRGVWTGPITSGGTITLTANENVTVTRTNYDIGRSDVASIPVQTPVPEPTTTPTHAPTTNGGKLPKTATPYRGMLILGATLLIAGTFGFRLRKSLVK